MYTHDSPSDIHARWPRPISYEPAPLEARIEETIETPDWTREKITFNGADGERAIAYLYLPRHVAAAAAGASLRAGRLT